MSRLWWVLLAGCGRLGFERPLADVGADAADVTLDLVARYPMDDDPSGGTITCTVPAAAATCDPAGECPVRVPGHLGSAARFAGAQRARIPQQQALLGSGAFTVTAWIATTAIVVGVEVAMFVAKPYSTASIANSFAMSVSSGEKLRYESTDAGGSGEEYLDGTAVIVDGQWHHVAASYDGATKRLYVDGKLEGEKLIDIADAPYDVLLGDDEDDGTPLHFYVGDLDELRFYARALADAEIAILAAQ